MVSSREPSRLHRRVVALCACASFALLLASPAQAQSYTWGDSGSTTATTDYNLGTNWSNQAAVPPPIAAGQAAIFELDRIGDSRRDQRPDQSGQLDF